MYKPSRIYFRRQEACDSLALDFSTLDASSEQEQEEQEKETQRAEQMKEQGGWRQELVERERRGSIGQMETQEQRKF